jgi:hypothetical protein
MGLTHTLRATTADRLGQKLSNMARNMSTPVTVILCQRDKNKYGSGLHSTMSLIYNELRKAQGHIEVAQLA